MARLGKRRRTQSNGGGDVGALGADDGLDFGFVHDGFRFGFQRRLGAKHQHATTVFFFLGGGGLVYVLERALLLRGRNAVRSVEQEHHIHAFHRTQPLHAGQRQHQQRGDNEADAQRRPPPPGSDLHVGFERQPNHPPPRHRQREQPKRMGELEVH